MKHVTLLVVLVFIFAGNVLAKGPKITDREKADEDFAYQGEYSGAINVDGSELKIGVQVIALGNGKFRSIGYHGGLPGDGWDGSEKHIGEGELEGDSVVMETAQAEALITDGEMIISVGGTEVGELERIERKSPTLGQKPPEGAIVLFDGKSVEGWENGKVTDNGLLMQGTKSKKTLQDHKLHIEFMLPYQPQDRGQGRGNSGIYLQGRYEVQMLDSFGLEGKHNECGGVYSIKDPDTNMCFPPLTWQTYDIDFTAAKYDTEGKVTANPRMTVRHNGVVVHKDLELPKSTTASPNKPGAEPGPIYLQDHGCPVRYRNIWAVEL